MAALGATWTAAHWPALVAAAEHAHKAVAFPENQKWEFFTPGEASEVEAIASSIIPSDGTPGARDAGVVYFLDPGPENLSPRSPRNSKACPRAFPRGFAILRGHAGTTGSHPRVSR